MDERELRFDGRMSDHESVMWSLELDPVLRSTFANVTYFDRPPDQARFRARMERAARLVPRLRQRVGDAPAGVGAPTWVEDPLFDLDFHIRRVALPAPGDERALLDLAALLSLDPFDRARPLWQFTIVEGLPGGRAAMVQKLHHTITDGEGGVRMSTMFVDLERDADAPMDAARAGDPAAEAAAAATSTAALRPSVADTVRDAVGEGVRRPLALARRAVSDAVDTLTHPGAAPGKAGDALETARSVVRQLAVTEPARSPLWTERSLRRHLGVLSVDLGEAKRAASGLGGTVNDLFVTGAIGAAGAYHRAKGAEVGELRMAMPISTRPKGGTEGNSFAPTRLLVPAGMEDPVERFHAVRAVIQAIKGERAIGATGGVAGLLASLPAGLLTRVARQQVGTVDFTTSNVRGAPFELYIAGAKIEANYPIGPMAGTAFNLTTLSYDGRLDMGLMCDVAAVADPPLLHSCLVEAYAELLALG